jgi:hypothetical protein
MIGLLLGGSLILIFVVSRLISVFDVCTINTIHACRPFSMKLRLPSSCGDPSPDPW